jgi:hypothetical protein
MSRRASRTALVLMTRLCEGSGVIVPLACGAVFALWRALQWGMGVIQLAGTWHWSDLGLAMRQGASSWLWQDDPQPDRP